jgi:hypothetical protein
LTRDEIAAAKATVDADLAALLERLDRQIAEAHDRAENAHDDLAASCHRQTAAGAERIRVIEIEAAAIKQRNLDSMVPEDG